MRFIPLTAAFLLTSCASSISSTTIDAIESDEAGAHSTLGWVAWGEFDDHGYAYTRRGPVRATEGEAEDDVWRIVRRERVGELVTSRVVRARRRQPVE